MYHIKAVLLLYMIISTSTKCYSQEPKDLVNIVKFWGENLGKQLRTLSNIVTSRKKIIDSFKQTKVVYESGNKIREEIADKIRVMMALKEEAVKNIAEKAEYLSLNRKEPIFTNSSYDYYNTDNISNTTADPDLERKLNVDVVNKEEQFKCDELEYIQKSGNVTVTKNPLSQNSHYCENPTHTEYEKDHFRHLPLAYHPQFDTLVNLDYSVLRIATSIYDRDEAILNDVRWSEALDLVFKKNFKTDPTLIWQYFAGTTGFMRHYPAIQWPDEKYQKTYEFRTRAWYLEAVSSPKDVIILLDMSGSMWQLKWATAKFLVNSLLDTLGDNDYVNVYLFNNATHPLVDCFNYTLMQAHEENLRLLRESLDKHKPQFTGDLSKAFKLAFATLAQYKEIGGKVHCNQIIMLISEGIDYDYKAAELFKTYNRTNPYYTEIRVFTFLIGTEPSDAAQMEWIACANMGYYVNITCVKTIPSDVAEKVLKYLSVLSRPLNLNYHLKPEPIWTGAYADLADRRLCNWLWNKYEGNQQRQIFIDYTRQAYQKYNCIFSSNDDHFLLRDDHEYAQYLGTVKYNYMTTVSLPVYDKRPGETTILGIAAVDVPIEYIKMLTMPDKIGVNGYAFILTNNGLLLLHPDHRKEFNLHVSNILKPTYNRVDITEVELVDDLNEPRDFNKAMLEMRDNIVKHGTGFKRFNVKTHLDNMKRVILSKRYYFYTNIGPFSLVIAIPDKYGFHKITYEGEKVLELRPTVNQLSGLNNTKNWRIHPEWFYCKDYGKDRLIFKSCEMELLHFLNKLERQGPEWNKYCNPALVNKLILDAKVTEWYETHYTDDPVELNIAMNKLQVSVTFLATHTGLTRWRSSVDDKTEPDFIKSNNKAIDEVWYKRAVEYNFKNSESFIFSTAFDRDNPTFITASNAIYRENGQMKAPIAVVGFQFAHSNLNDIFSRSTHDLDDLLMYDTKSTCILMEIHSKFINLQNDSSDNYYIECGSERCLVTCESKELNCFLLDDNAYIVAANNEKEVGKLIGNINPYIIQRMVEDGVYSQVRIFDYQGICYIDPPKPKPKTRSPAQRNSVFYGNVFGILNWLYASVICYIKSAMGATTTKDNPCLRAITPEYNQRAIKKSLPTPCDREKWLYTLKNTSVVGTYINTTASTARNCMYYIVQPVSNSNLILLVVNAECSTPNQNVSSNLESVELKYNMTMPCYIATKNNYTRRQYIACINNHEKESTLYRDDKKYCGVTWKTT